MTTSHGQDGSTCIRTCCVVCVCVTILWWGWDTKLYTGQPIRMEYSLWLTAACCFVYLSTFCVDSMSSLRTCFNVCVPPDGHSQGLGGARTGTDDVGSQSFSLKDVEEGVAGGDGPYKGRRNPQSVRTALHHQVLKTRFSSRNTQRNVLCRWSWMCRPEASLYFQGNVQASVCNIRIGCLNLFQYINSWNIFCCHKYSTITLFIQINVCKQFKT